MAGGVHNALIRGQEIGATTVQIFTSNQKQWNGRVFTSDDLLLWREALESTGIREVMSHDSYLINLGSNKEELLLKSRNAFRKEIERCLELGLTYMNFHPGAATGDTDENCLNRIVDSLLELEDLMENHSLRLLIEATAGQGSTMGYRFEHLGYIIDRVKDKVPIGVCIDTCHIFAAGYDIRDEAGWNKTLEAFDHTVGLEHLYALHVNDSLQPLGSRKDRHANLGKGEIGIKCFEVMMTHPKLRHLPKYLETPNGDKMWKDEIALLRSYAKVPKKS
ncbi:deoxyribonuclease IV [Candidatus Neptunochlamydia vexilliferae]|uniref:deoxyribonuclease IV n=1 Tax=Candidatus Neptunichlamydia vexilliferae TaxID=1651774 RepID=UPI002264CECC|nr:deoxyribonuclease IV [Candidatus Neptunochlamydia vexilliferae]